jgi:predicted aldo/keto reductase-like oxidoreductase
MIMEPLRGGVLAGKLPEDVQKFYDNAKVKRSPAEWGLRWVWNHPDVTVVLSGMNEESQIEENIKTAETALPNSLKPEELTTIKNVAETYRKLLKVACTGCQYCMPCINSINIPGNFQIYNQYRIDKEEQKARGMYAMMLMGGLNGKRADAALCKACKQCIQRCPQHIDIPEELKAVAKELGSAKTEAVLAMMKANMASKTTKKAE